MLHPSVKSVEEIRDMSDEERRELLARVSFPKVTEHRRKRLDKLSDEQVMEALTTALWVGMTVEQD